ncbi:protein IWS11 [Sesamum alatum]|uniref:Protein IWS11 n=1 Tax=Sesamum alatum TaxID=300844 RepID=A0AAE2CHP0_9LAMI|nr:protein IWS11 [Sesamum alatum]
MDNCYPLLDDQDGVRTVDDDNFIDDSGVDPADRYGSDNEHSPSRAPQELQKVEQNDGAAGRALDKNHGDQNPSSQHSLLSTSFLTLQILCLLTADDQEGFRNVDDDNFIDDGDVDPDDSDVDTDDSDLDTDDSDVDTDDSDLDTDDSDLDTDDSDMDSEDSDGSGDEDSPIYAPKDDQEDIRTVDEYNFIDDSDVDPDDSYRSGSEHSPISAPQAEEDEEMKELFEMGKNKKTNEKSAAEMALLVENVMAELKVVSEEDAELHRQGKSAVNKLEKLSLLTDVLSKKHLHQEFLDHGGLTLLKNWLEPLPDGNLPDINIRAAVLKILNDFPIDLQQSDRRGLLKRSGLGKVIMFLSMSAEETIANQKLAKKLVDKWMNN